MENKKIITVFALIIIAQVNAFSQVFSFEGGANYFLGDLQKEIRNSPYGAAGLEFELSNYTFLYLQGAFSYQKLKRNLHFYGLYQFIGRAGIETPEQLLNPFVIGIGISMAAVRGRDKNVEEAKNYMLSTSESEFGWNVRVELNLFKIEKFKFGLRFHYDEVWTAPKNSSLLHGGIFVGY